MNLKMNRRSLLIAALALSFCPALAFGQEPDPPAVLPPLEPTRGLALAWDPVSLEAVADPVPENWVLGYSVFTRPTLGPPPEDPHGEGQEVTPEDAAAYQEDLAEWEAARDNWTWFAETNDTELEGQFPTGPFDTAVTAWYDVLGEDGQPAGRFQSDKSFALQIPPTPPVPEGYRLKITIELETSETMEPESWRPVATIAFPETGAPKQFFRTR